MRAFEPWFVVPAMLGMAALGAPGTGDVPFTVAAAPWPLPLGNQRVVIGVSGAAAGGAVRVRIPWRRRDPDPGAKGFVLLPAAGGEAVRNLVRIEITREAAEIAFEPVAGPGNYTLYTMPFTPSGGPADYKLQYLPVEDTADAGWRERHGLAATQLAGGRWRELPEALPIGIEARSEFHSFSPMEVIATAAEVQELLDRHAAEPYLLFPEDRRFAIRMTDDLPTRWVNGGPSAEFAGEAQRGEFYAFQIGVYAARQSLEAVDIEFGDLAAAGGARIPAAALRCLNLGGTDWLGRQFRKEVAVPQGRVQALWCGVQVPAEAVPGVYTGTVTVRPRNAPARPVRLALKVLPEVIRKAGEDDLWRLARLQWLDSKIGVDDEATAPYTAMTVEGRVVRCLGREVEFAGNGLPARIRSGATEILARPLQVVVQTAAGRVQVGEGTAAVTVQTPGRVEWAGAATGKELRSECSVRMEFDGYLNVTVRLTPVADLAADDVALEIPLRREVARYLMGLGREGGFRPPEWSWTWDAGRANNMVWLGDVNAGLQCKLKGPTDTWDIYNLTAGVPATWGNQGHGGCQVREVDTDTVLVRAFTGARQFKAGEPLELRFGLLITPVKPLDPAHWDQRYYHDYVPAKKAIENGANIINIHHGNPLNPNINYPFIEAPQLREYVSQAHEAGVRVKIYYTVRELSTYLPELWALRSLGHEVFNDGGGGGSSWLREHLGNHYGPAWHHLFADGEVDGAIGTAGLSRWHNYYLEGLRWLIENVGVDGLYLDGIGYDREVMKRVRKVMDRARPGCLIDFHSGNEFPFADLRVSPANKYMEHFPYVNSLWFGEMYDYDRSPDYWLVEVSGIPFGLFGEMLQNNGNPWRGMIYGMTARYYSGADPKHIWKLWDEFGIQRATMVGYWDPACPVRTGHADVLATVYRRDGAALVSIASWAKERVRATLTVDWAALGLDPAKATFYAPAVQGFQRAALFKPGEAIPVSPGRGWLLVVDEQAHEVPARADAYAGREVLWEDAFERAELGESWKVTVSPRPGTALALREGAIQLSGTANICALAERALPPGTTLVECRVYSGSDGGVSWGTGLGIAWPQAFARLCLSAFGNFQANDGAHEVFAGSSNRNTWYRLRLRLEPGEVVAEVSEDGDLWETITSWPRERFPGDPVAVRLGKMSPRGTAEDFTEPGVPGASALDEVRVWGVKR
jgi:hypothetical protein